MAATRYGDLTVALKLPSGKSTYVKIGSVIEMEVNDPSKGLPYIIMLDPWIDLQALHAAGQFDSMSLPASIYKAKNRDWPPPEGSTRRQNPAPDYDDNTPF